MRSLSTMRELKIMTLNTENLFTEADIPQSGGGNLGKGNHNPDQAFKDESKMQKMRVVINEADPDFMILQEVGSLESLQELINTPPLKGKYKALLKEGNDRFHIGFLVKADMDLKYRIEGHTDMTFFDAIERREMPVFSRDLPALIVTTANSTKPAMIIFGNHAKSKRDREGDPESTHLRTKQYEVAAQLVKQYQDLYGADVPIMFAGDFNTDVQKGPEVAPLKSVLESSFNVAKSTDLPKDRITHTFHPNDEPTEYHQLDDVMVSAALKKSVIEAHVVPYKDSNGKVMPPASNWGERNQQPSDHRPVLIKLSTEGFNTTWIALPFDLVA
jgi:predicted extracellular nuclease